MSVSVARWLSSVAWAGLARSEPLVSAAVSVTQAAVDERTATLAVRRCAGPPVGARPATVPGVSATVKVERWCVVERDKKKTAHLFFASLCQQRLFGSLTLLLFQRGFGRQRTVGQRALLRWKFRVKLRFGCRASQHRRRGRSARGLVLRRHRRVGRQRLKRTRRRSSRVAGQRWQWLKRARGCASLVGRLRRQRLKRTARSGRGTIGGGLRLIRCSWILGKLLKWSLFRVIALARDRRQHTVDGAVSDAGTTLPLPGRQTAVAGRHVRSGDRWCFPTHGKRAQILRRFLFADLATNVAETNVSNKTKGPSSSSDTRTKVWPAIP